MKNNNISFRVFNEESVLIQWNDKIKIGEKIPVLLERIEDKNGEVLVSASKAQKIKGWDKLVEAYEKKEPIMGKRSSKCKGGCIVEHIDTGALMFLPGSQISTSPLKNFEIDVICKTIINYFACKRI